ncbi:MAG: N-acetylmuramoyl-L-alanine amidase [Xanthomonadales bacterium]|nr:N-acetylmuramoyl-L-alanine amidase [Xanthomonadales bacterium]
MHTRLLIAVLLFLGSMQAFAAEVSGFRVWADPVKTRAVLDLDRKTAYKLFTLQDPHRVVVDLQGTSIEIPVELDKEHAGIISSVRYGQPDKKTLRVVFDLTDSVELKSFLLEPTAQYSHRLVIDLYSRSNRQAPTMVKHVADISKPDRDVVIAIDAGHGGEDPGAIGKKKTQEKHVVLQIARRLKKAIDAEPGMKAILTRDGDYYIPLRGRYEKARKARSDLFVSIHADAFTKRSVRGSSVFVLSPRGASSEFARLLADSENASDLVGGVTLNDKDDMLASVLLDLSQSATREASNKVANDILGSMKRTGTVHKPHVGRANFMVLKSPDVPSVLIETAFISNPGEEKRLTEKEFQQRMARTITRGIKDYFYSSPPPGTWIAANRDGQKYIVARGDTLGGIASRYSVSLNRLRTANNIRGDVIHVGRELVIPTS